MSIKKKSIFNKYNIERYLFLGSKIKEAKRATYSNALETQVH
jgi:hypothetical protein